MPIPILKIKKIPDTDTGLIPTTASKALYVKDNHDCCCFCRNRERYTVSTTTTIVIAIAYKNFATKEPCPVAGKKYSISPLIASFHAKPATSPSAAVIYPSE